MAIVPMAPETDSRVAVFVLVTSPSNVAASSPPVISMVPETVPPMDRLFRPPAVNSRMPAVGLVPVTRSPPMASVSPPVTDRNWPLDRAVPPTIEPPTVMVPNDDTVRTPLPS